MEAGIVAGNSLLEQIRCACREVAAQAQLVHIDDRRLPDYAAELSTEKLEVLQMDAAVHYLEQGEGTVAFFLTLDSINFGSGYFPSLVKPPGRSGYAMVASALAERFRRQGPFSAASLANLSAAECAALFGQKMENPHAGTLMALFAGALNDLGHFLLRRFNGRFAEVVEAAGGSAERLVQILREMPAYRDVAEYRGHPVPFYKRAQITAADLHIAFAGQGPGCFDDIDRLTILADNLVPHVLREDGVLRYREDLAAHIDSGRQLPAGSIGEVEIRACAVCAGELLVAELARGGRPVNALQLDNFLWHRGQWPRYRVRPRHRTCSLFY